MSLLRKRVLRVFAVIVMCLFWEVGLVYILAFVSDHVPDWRNLSEIKIFGGNILIPASLIFYRHKRYKPWIKEEAENWVANRSAEGIARTKKWHRAFWRGMLWIPSLIALSVFLFLPEAMGLVSHTFDLQFHDLNGHRVHTPLTSYVRSYKNLYVSALIGRGIGRVGPLPYIQKELPLSSLFFYAIVNPRLDHYRDRFLTSDNVRSRRTLSFGSEMMTCADVTSQLDASTSDLVQIECLSSDNDVSADFYGLREDVSTFYEMLNTSTEPPTIRIFRSLPPSAPER
jgi:hypothetical protein